MNILEGARRIQKVGRVAMAVSMVAAISTLCLLGVSSVTLGSFHINLMVMPLFLFFSIYPVIIGTIFLVMGWIVEGFAMPPSKSHASGD
jgi:hypothetical protein